MRLLTAVPNTDPGSTDYPNGRVRDKAGVTDGTTGGEVLFGDITQFFQKLVIDAGITENTLPDNVTNGYQLVTALMGKIKIHEAWITATVNAALWTTNPTLQYRKARTLS